VNSKRAQCRSLLHDFTHDFTDDKAGRDLQVDSDPHGCLDLGRLDSPSKNQAPVGQTDPSHQHQQGGLEMGGLEMNGLEKGERPTDGLEPEGLKMEGLKMAGLDF
jgi:hypothetical protein